MRKNTSADRMHQIKEAYAEFIGWTDADFEQEMEDRFIYSKMHRDEISLFREEIVIDHITPIDNKWCELEWHVVHNDDAFIHGKQKTTYFLMPRYFIGKTIFAEGYFYVDDLQKVELLFLYYNVYDMPAFPNRNKSNFVKSGIFGFFKIEDVIQRAETQQLIGTTKTGDVKATGLLIGGKIIDINEFVGKRYIWNAMRFDMLKAIPEDKQNWYIQNLYINLDLSLMKKAAELYDFEELSENLISSASDYDVVENNLVDEDREY